MDPFDKAWLLNKLEILKVIIERQDPSEDYLALIDYIIRALEAGNNP